jgi:peptidoglycan/xylan/chitin deacetylase (PgdA/CDA1 family)
MQLTRLNLVTLACGAAGAASAAAFDAPALSLGVPAAAFLALVTDGIVRPSSSVAYPTLTHGPRHGNRVALTFDDGPDPAVTPAVIDALAKHEMRATFFAIGRWLEAHPRLARDIVSAGNELGGHSWSHWPLQGFLGVPDQQREIRRSLDAVAAVTGARSPLYRPPNGLRTPPMARAAYREQLTLETWSLHSHDVVAPDPERIARRVLGRIRPGDIVLMHDGHERPGRHRPASSLALPQILEGLRARGLESVTVTELIQPARRPP